MTLRWQGFATGFLGLAALDVLVGTKNASTAVGGMAAGAGNLVRKVLSPAVPAFSKAPPAPASAPKTGAGVSPSNPPGVSQGGNEPGGVGPPTTVPPNPTKA